MRAVKALGTVWEMAVTNGWFLLLVVGLEEGDHCTALVLCDDEFPKNAGVFVSTDMGHIGRNYRRLA